MSRLSSFPDTNLNGTLPANGVVAACFGHFKQDDGYQACLEPLEEVGPCTT